MSLSIAIQAGEFDVAAEYAALRRDNTGDGAAAMFVGSVRDFNAGSSVQRLQLEHYPGMGERALTELAERARQRWALGRVRIVHRYGVLQPGDDIVFVGATAAHRQAALDACAYLMDWLKCRAPFWKKELGPGGDTWVRARESDREALEKW